MSRTDPRRVAGLLGLLGLTVALSLSDADKAGRDWGGYALAGGLGVALGLAMRLIDGRFGASVAQSRTAQIAGGAVVAAVMLVPFLRAWDSLFYLWGAFAGLLVAVAVLYPVTPQSGR
jgi:hypothetical protein